MQVPCSGVHCAVVVHDVPLFWLWPQLALTLHAALLPTAHADPTLPCVHVPLMAGQLAFDVHEVVALFEHVPFLTHWAVGLAVVVQAAPTLPVVQLPPTWQGTLGLALVAQAAPTLPLVHAPVTVHWAACVQVNGAFGPRLLVQLPGKSQSVLTLQGLPAFLLFVHVFPPSAGHWPLLLHCVVALLEQVPVVGQVAAVAQLVVGELLHTPLIALQFAAVVHALPAGLAHVPLLAMIGQLALLTPCAGQLVPVVIWQCGEIDGQVPGDE